MPSLIDLRRRIRAVKSTQQITKAMKMIAASRLKRAQDRVVAARPFAQRMLAVLNGLVANVDQDAHPLLRIPDEKSGRTLLIVITADRGLCGSFNTNVTKAAGQFIVNEGRGREIALGLVGRKGRDTLGRRGLPVKFEYVNLPKVIHFAEAEAVAQPAVTEFIEGRVDSVHLIYNEFKSVMQQKVVMEQLLPLAPITEEEQTAARSTTEYLYEPSAQRIFEVLLGRLVEAQLLRALLESNAAFYAAQMTAMDAATRNSADMIEGLTLTMNKVRQAAITREIIEVVSGAQAL